MMGARLKELAEAAGYPSLADFARRAGVKPQAAQKQASRGSIPARAAERYITAARSTGADIAWLLTGKGNAPRRISPEQKSTIAIRLSETVHSRTRGVEHSPIPAPPGWASDVTMPLRETEEVAGAGYFMLSPVVVAELPRPGSISVQTPVFAIYVQSDDMDPRYERGDRLLVNPALPLEPGKDYLFLTQPDEKGKQRAIIRRLVSFTDSHWRVKVYYPEARTYAESRADWPIWHRIEAVRGR